MGRIQRTGRLRRTSIRKARRCSDIKRRSGKKKKNEEYYAPRKNHIMAALKFNERRQADSESFDSFVMNLKILVKDNGYQEEERMVRDAIVFLCKHTKVREKCLDLAPLLTLEKAVEIGRNHETNLNSLKKLEKDEDPTVNVANKLKKNAKLGVVVSVKKKAQISKTPKRNLRKEKKDQTRKTSVVTTRPTRTVQQWDNSAVSAKT